jgi:hypothetical protein
MLEGRENRSGRGDGAVLGAARECRPADLLEG